MSFYQPSLSLYDVLNALNSQAPARDPREQLFRNQGYVQKPPAYRPYGAGCPVGLPAGLLYRLPGDTCYYRPNYYYTGEDEDDEGEAAAEAEAKAEAEAEAEEEAEELEEAERAARAERAERAQQEASYGQLPSYYHSRAPKGGIQDNYEEADPVSDLLTALLGGTPAYVQAPPQPPSRRSTSAADDLVKQALLEKLGLTQDNQEEKPKDGSQVTGNEEKPDELQQQSNPKEKLPFPLNRKQPSQNHSSVPDPLQVSKPEARLDLPFSPELNVYDCPDQYVVAVALPGATSKAFKVDYHPSTHELILKGDVEDKLGISEDYLKVTELKYGAFQRTVKFPIVPRIKDEEIKASYKNGILQVKVPKILGESEKPAPKKRIVIEDVPDEELEYEEHPALSL